LIVKSKEMEEKIDTIVKKIDALDIEIKDLY
jgi:hypothetical protein